MSGGSEASTPAAASDRTYEIRAAGVKGQTLAYAEQRTWRTDFDARWEAAQ